MKEFTGMLTNRVPDAINSRWYRLNAHRFPPQVQALQRIRNRRPDLYEAGMVALVNWAVGEMLLYHAIPPELSQNLVKGPRRLFRS